MRDWYKLSWSDVVRDLKSDANLGLTEDKIKESRDAYGHNKTLNLERKNLIVLFIKYLCKINFILGIIICILFLNNDDFINAFFLCTIILTSVLLLCVKDSKNEDKLNNLRSIIPRAATVIRNGAIININPDELVVGDIVYVKRGDIVPADLRILECENLKVNESDITGDVRTVEKYETRIEDDALLLTEMRNILFKSSKIVSGKAKGIVIAVGEETEIGKIITNSLYNYNRRGNIDKNIIKVIEFMAAIFLIFPVLIILYAFYTKRNLNDFINLVSLGYLTLIPTNIIIVVSIISRIIKSNLKRLNFNNGELLSMEMLSQVNMITINKIGILTEEYMVAEKLFLNGKIINATLEKIDDSLDNKNRLIDIGLICCNKKCNINEKANFNNMMEKAILKYALENSSREKALHIDDTIIFTIPYDYDRRIETTVNKVEDKYRANVIGDVESLLQRCTHIMKYGVEIEITPKDIEEIKKANYIMSKGSLNTIGFAYRNFNYEPSNKENIESNLVFVGLMGINNPLKEDSVKAIDFCRKIAIKPVVITEDNKIAATFFGKKIGLINKNDVVLSGVEIDNMNDSEFERLIERTGIISRITSKNKLKISKAFKNLGYNLAVVGSKLNDVPSFRASDVGIAIGKDCSEITKKLGDVFVENKGFSNLISIIDLSRKIVINIYNVILFNIVASIIEFLTIFIMFILFKNIPIKVTDIFYINFVTALLSSLLLYTQYNNIEGNNYEKLKQYENVFKRFTFGTFLYTISMAFIYVICFRFLNNKGILENASAFIVLGINPIICSFKFMNIKKVITNKISLFVLLLNIIFFGAFLKIFYFI